MKIFFEKLMKNEQKISSLAIPRSLASLYLLMVISGSLASTHVIRTKLGLLEGVTKEARYKKLFHAYYGIPFAKAPIGKLRFEPPVEAGAWSGIFNATALPLPCPQFDKTDEVYKGQEDCLYLHVYTPKNVTAGSNVPVIFYIFGGQFKYASAGEIGVEFLMSRDVVIVVPSYRLGVMGFLSTGDTVIAGNMALKDQSLAMKWTKENIYEFGGDPNRITLHGHSSGAICAHLHTLSPTSKEYFHQIILQSGFGSSPMAFKDQDYSLGTARALAARVNCPADSSEVLKECLQRKTHKELVLASEKLSVWSNESTPSVFLPVIEDRHVENAFLNENPVDAPYVSNRKPLLVGITSSEAAQFVGRFLNSDPTILNITPELLFPLMGYFGWTSKPSHLNFITRILRTHFFGEGDIRDAAYITDLALVEMLTGIVFGYSFIDVVEKYKGLTYAYLFDYRYVSGYTTSPGGRDGKFLGVSHVDEWPIIFVDPDKVDKIAEEDFAFGDEIITRWINFVYSGNPNIPFPINTNVFGAWSPVSSPRLEFLRITNGGTMERDYFVERFGFWRKIPFFSKYR